MVEIDYCTRCGLEEPEDAKILLEITGFPTRSIEDISQQIDKYKSIEEMVNQQLQKRLKERQEKLENYKQKLKDHEEELSFQALEQVLKNEEIDQIAARIMADEGRREMEKAINALRYQPVDVDYMDVEAVLQKYQWQGYIDIEEGRIKITAKGARLLAKQTLGRVLASLAKKDIGIHRLKDTGYGSEISTYSRRYELGDAYELVHIEETILNTLERSKVEGSSRPARKMQLKAEDFRVFETQYQSRMCAGIIIDESGSMQTDNKLEAAIAASLALSELINREPKDLLKVFIFSEKVRNIPSWEIVNAVAGRGNTDIRAGMRAFRLAARMEKGDKQAYLITDADPNFEDGIHIGLEKAMEGILQEALHYREDGITLNIIMLDQRPALKKLARILAQKNLGRVLFTNPSNLGGVIIEDFLKAKTNTS